MKNTSFRLSLIGCFVVFNLIGGLSAFSQDLLPVGGRWNAYDAVDYTGVWKKSRNKAYLDAAGYGSITGVTALIGNSGDIPLTLDYTGDRRDEFALYRPSEQKLIFFPDFARSGEITLVRTVGHAGDLVATGNWNGYSDPKDGFVLYRSGTFEFYQNYDSSTPFYTASKGVSGAIPLAGDWDGNGTDGFAYYDPSARTFTFYQEYNSSTPFLTWTVGNSGDMVMTGDWDGDGDDGICLFRKNATDDYRFWFYPTLNTGPLWSVPWLDTNTPVANITRDVDPFYTTGVPHVGFDGTFRTTFHPDTSFLPKALYNSYPAAFDDIHDAGFNLAMLWKTDFPLDQAGYDALDATDNELRVVPYLPTTGGRPFSGRFNGTNDLPGVSASDGSRFYYVDTNADASPDLSFVTGNTEDIAFAMNWDGDSIDEFAVRRPSERTIAFFNGVTDRTAPVTITVGTSSDIVIAGDWTNTGSDGYALFRPSSGQILFFSSYTTTTSFHTTSAGTTGDLIIAGDWDGDHDDEFAIYTPSTRTFAFYHDYNSISSFASRTTGNPGDIPISGDFDGDRKDDFGVYRVDAARSLYQFWLLDDPADTTWESIIFGNPVLEENKRPYIFGAYTADEPSGGNENFFIYNARYTYLNSVYDAFSDQSSQIFLHTDLHYRTGASRVWWELFTDIGEAASHDDYPLKDTDPNPATNTPDIINSISHIAITVEKSREQIENSKPNWFTAQAFAQRIGSDTFYVPTTAQYKSMIYTAIVHGATGIFTFNYPNPAFNGDIDGISPSHNSSLWSMAADVNSELETLKPYILSSNSQYFCTLYTPDNPAYEDYPIRTILKYYNGSYVLIAVNMTKETLPAIIQLPAEVSPDADENGEAEVLFESRTEVTLSSAINDTFDPFEVHVYKWTPPTGISGRIAAPETATIVPTERERHNVRVYPNPATANITFEVNSDKQDAELKIYDTTGRIVFSTNKSSDEKDELKFSWDGVGRTGTRVSPGIYIYKILGSSNFESTGKFIMN